MKCFPFSRIRVSFRRLLVVGFVLIYLAMGGMFFYFHLLGDSTKWPRMAYFWTWDMFPNYPSFSARRMALGQTQSGKFVKVFPTEKIRFRRGGHRHLTRFDLPRNNAALRIATEQTLQAVSAVSPVAAKDRVTYVFLVENYWPVRFNLPDDLYQKTYDEENPHRRAWRILDEGSVENDGQIGWTMLP